MTVYQCEKCDKNFSSKANLLYHTVNKVCSVEKSYRCNKCGTGFAHRSSRSRHEKNCTNAQVDNESDDIDKKVLLQQFEEMRRMNLEMMDKIAKLENRDEIDRVTNVNNGSIHNGDVNTINNITVNVVPFGKEDLSKIDKNELLKVFRSGFNSALRLTETTHFNPKYPEYHNVYISNMKNKYAMTFDGDDWALVMKDDLIDKIYDNKRDYIEENMDEFINSLLPSQINALHRWLNVDDDHQYVQKVKNEMKLMLYNKRKMALDPKPVEITDIEEPSFSVKVIKEPKHVHNEPMIIRRSRIAPRNGRFRKTVVRRKNN